jgi:ATP-dependent RNA helicase DeaD
MLFSEFNLKAWLLKALTEMKYDNATDIQAKVIKLTLDGKNIVGQSQTGTGKTAAFLIPLLQKIDTNQRWLQSLILAPTRELVNQIGEEIVNLTKYYRVNAACIYGGASPVLQKKILAKWPSIIVATPGRLLDFINQRVIDISKVRFLVLDEVDRMLDMWFIRDIQKIRAQMKSIEQTSTFSATISDDIKKIIKEHVSEYESIKIGEAITVDKINHSFISVPHQDKIFNLLHIIKKHPDDKIVIFTQTKRNTKTLSAVIEKAGYNVGMLNGNMSQGKRNSTLKSFKDNTLKILVTTDVAARGLNMDNVGLVVNFDVPKESQSYIHRIGRTGRAWAAGKAIMLVSPEEHGLFADIERTHRTRIKRSDHMPVSDTQWQFTMHRLDKSTDKFGKGRPNPSRWERWSHSASSSRATTYPSRTESFHGRREDSRWAKPSFRWWREEVRSSSAPAHGAKRPFRGIGKWYGPSRNSSPAKKSYR